MTNRPSSRRAIVARHRRVAPRVIGGVDVDKAVAAMRRLSVFQDHPLPRRIDVEVGFTETRGTRGTAWPWERRMRIQGWVDSKPERVLETLLHELVHLACPNGAHHGERFRRVFARAAREMWGIEVPIDPDRGHHANASYAQGELVVAALKDREHPFAPEPPKPKKPRREVIDEKIRARAEHARKMLKKAITRRKRAETIEKKWKKAKVDYYGKKGL